MAVASGVAVAAVLGAVLGHVAWQPTSSTSSASAPAQTTPSGGSGSPGSEFGGAGGSGGAGGPGPANAASIAQNVDPGLVDINTSLAYQGEQAAGTGMVLSSNGEVLTNNHVIEGATKISVTDVGNGKTYDASVAGYDKSHDVAVLQLVGASGLQTVKLGSSSNLSVGQGVVGIGNAGGSGGTPSYAGGTITALNQSITASDQSSSTSEQLNGVIQTNANIQPGDSGGPLVDTSGQVVGIDTAASSGFQFQSPSSSGSQGFAIPIDQATSIARNVEAGTSTSAIHVGPTAFLGVEVTNAGSTNSGNGFGGFGGSDGLGGLGGFGNQGNSGSNGSNGSGAMIIQSGVANGTPAAKAGLQGGDTITGFNGQTVSSPNDLTKYMLQQKPGDTVTLTYTDPSGQAHTAQVQLASGPPQ